MNYKVQRIITEYQGAVVRFTGFIITSLIFLSGIGRYRVVMLYAAYSLIDAIFTIKKPVKQIQYIWFPAIVIGLYLDLTEGPFLPVFSRNYILLAVPLMIVADQLARNYVEKVIEQHSDKRLFVVCPSCNYQNEALVEKCTQCGFKNGDAVHEPNISSHGTKYNIKPKVLRMLNLSNDEEILYCLSGSLTFFMNGDRDAILYFVITNQQIIFLDYFRFNIRFVDSWRVKYTVPISQVARVAGKMKKLYLAEQPFLIIESSAGDSYEIVYSNFGKKKNELKEVANIIAKGNPQAAIEMDLPDAPARQSIWE